MLLVGSALTQACFGCACHCFMTASMCWVRSMVVIALEANTTYAMARAEWQVGSLATTCISVPLLPKQPMYGAFMGDLSIH